MDLNLFDECSQQLNTIKENQVKYPPTNFYIQLEYFSNKFSYVLFQDSITMFLMGKLEYLRGNHQEALAILKEIPVIDNYT